MRLSIMQHRRAECLTRFSTLICTGFRKKSKGRISIPFLQGGAPQSSDSKRFMGHPLPNEIGTRDQVECIAFSAHEIKQRSAVHLFQVLEIEQYPQLAGTRRLNQLIQIRTMTLK